MTKLKRVLESSTPMAGGVRSNLLILHSEKGGAGKSYAAALAASRALYLGWPIHVLETDKGVPDVAPRFLSFPGAKVHAVSLDPTQDVKQVLIDLLSFVEGIVSAADCPRLIVINSPAGASYILDDYATIFSDVARGLGIQLTVGFLVDSSAAVVPGIERSMESGLLAIPGARRALVYAGWAGDPKTFPLASSQARELALQAGLVEHIFPDAGRPIIAMTSKHVIPFYQFTAPQLGLGIVQRSLVHSWLAACEPLADFLIGATDE